MKISASLLGLTVLASAVMANDTTTYRLAAHYRQGEQHRYSIVTAIVGIVDDNHAIGLQFAMRYKVLQTLPNSTKILLTYADPRSGKTVLPVKFRPSTVEVDKYNHPVKGSHAAQFFAAFPDHPVKIGDKWDAAYNLTLSATSGALLDVTYKLTGVKQDGPNLIAVLAMNIRGITPGEGTILVDAKDGSVLSSVLNVKIKDKEGKAHPVQIIAKRES